MFLVQKGAVLKLIIQIPCYNEAGTLAITLADLPRSVPGVDKVEWLVIDDGSADETIKVARECGVDYIIPHNRNRGLAAGFMTGLNACLERGADIIVNTDADNQYCAADIPALIRPILEHKAEYVIGTRPIGSIEHFSLAKKLLQKFGSFMVRAISGTHVEDAPSGFRALSRDAAMKINVFSSYTYTLETIIQAGKKDIPLACVPIRVNGELRPSRLFRSIPAYIRRSIFTMVRIFVIYSPARFFFSLGAFLIFFGVLLGGRFLYYYLAGNGQGMMQSLILTAILILMGGTSMSLGIIGDILGINRRLLEDIQYHQRRERYDRGRTQDTAE